MEIQNEFGLYSALFEIGDLFEELRRLGEIALGNKRTGPDDDRGGIVRLEFQGFVSKLFTLGLVAAGERPLGSGNIGFDCVPSLAHSLVQIGQADPDAENNGFSLQTPL